MKLILTISAALIFCFTSRAQLSGTTQVGRLIPLKKDTAPPVITLAEPVVKQGDTLKFSDNFVIISGVLSDENDSLNFYINNIAAQLTKENKFSKPVQLKDGLNSIQLTAVDKFKNTSSFNFSVLYTPLVIKPPITLLEPEINEEYVK